MLLAELTSDDWVKIITAIGTIIIVPIALTITQMVLSYMREQSAKTAREEVKSNVKVYKEETLRAAEEVKKDLHALTQDQNKQLVDIKMDVGIAKDDIRKVELATNSMKDALVQSTATAGQALGELKGRADSKLEARADSKLHDTFENTEVIKEDVKELKPDSK